MFAQDHEHGGENIDQGFWERLEDNRLDTPPMVSEDIPVAPAMNAGSDQAYTDRIAGQMNEYSITRARWMGSNASIDSLSWSQYIQTLSKKPDVGNICEASGIHVKAAENDKTNAHLLEGLAHAVKHGGTTADVALKIAWEMIGARRSGNKQVATKEFINFISKIADKIGTDKPLYLVLDILEKAVKAYPDNYYFNLPYQENYIEMLSRFKNLASEHGLDSSDPKFNERLERLAWKYTYSALTVEGFSDITTRGKVLNELKQTGLLTQVSRLENLIEIPKELLKKVDEIFSISKKSPSKSPSLSELEKITNLLDRIDFVLQHLTSREKSKVIKELFEKKYFFLDKGNFSQKSQAAFIHRHEQRSGNNEHDQEISKMLSKVLEQNKTLKRAYETFSSQNQQLVESQNPRLVLRPSGRQISPLRELPPASHEDVNFINYLGKMIDWARNERIPIKEVMGSRNDPNSLTSSIQQWGPSSYLRAEWDNVVNADHLETYVILNIIEGERDIQYHLDNRTVRDNWQLEGYQGAAETLQRALQDDHLSEHDRKRLIREQKYVDHAIQQLGDRIDARGQPTSSQIKRERFQEESEGVRLSSIAENTYREQAISNQKNSARDAESEVRRADSYAQAENAVANRRAGLGNGTEISGRITRDAVNIGVDYVENAYQIRESEKQAQNYYSSASVVPATISKSSSSTPSSQSRQPRELAGSEKNEETIINNNNRSRLQEARGEGDNISLASIQAEEGTSSSRNHEPRIGDPLSQEPPVDIESPRRAYAPSPKRQDFIHEQDSDSDIPLAHFMRNPESLSNERLINGPSTSQSTSESSPPAKRLRPQEPNSLAQSDVRSPERQEDDTNRHLESHHQYNASRPVEDYPMYISPEAALRPNQTRPDRHPIPREHELPSDYQAFTDRTIRARAVANEPVDDTSIFTYVAPARPRDVPAPDRATYRGMSDIVSTSTSQETTAYVTSSYDSEVTGSQQRRIQER